MKTTYKYIIGASLLLAINACTNLDLKPKSQATSENIFDDESSYNSFIARVYAGLAVSGQQGPSGDGDITGIDEGFSSYLRQYWKAQELTTDEAVIAWNDGNLPSYHLHTWTESNEFIRATYDRIYYQISIANQFMKETSDSKLNERGVSAEMRTKIKQYRAEARFLRALSYWHGLDLFGSNIPFVTEGQTFDNVQDGPNPASGRQIFEFIESELKAIEPDLLSPRPADYGRAGQAAAWTLLAKLYLNAKVYINEDRNTDCITYCNRVINSGSFALNNNYANLFKADNNGVPATEFIFTINFDASTRNFGGMTFLTHAAVGGGMNPADYGIDGGWWGLRTTKNLVNLFPSDSGATDKRDLFYRKAQKLEIESIGAFTDGLAVPKFVNVTSNSVPGANLTFPDTDFPLFRLADVYLMYAEAVLRGGTGGDLATATNYVNLIRERAYGNATGNINSSDLTLQFILDERARELYWEGHRRTDLVRFNQFTENGIWPWKGGVKEGVVTEKYRDIFPIPSTDLIANPKLKQNFGY